MKLFQLAALLFTSLSFCQESPVETANSKLNQFVNVRDFCMSTTNDEIYFTVQSPSQELSQIACMKLRNGKWSDPELLSFTTQFSDLEPFLSPDQTRLYFVSDRPLDASLHKKDYDIWYVARKNASDKWSAPINLGAPVNTVNNEFYPSLSANNNLYFTSDAPGGMGKDDIYLAIYKNGNYESPKPLDANINSAGYEFNAFISRNEDFLLFTKYNAPGGIGSGDLYIAHRDKTGNWSAAETLGPDINTKFMEYCPFYDEASGVLYFTSKRNSLTPRQFKNIAAFTDYMTNNENGLSKIYKVKINLQN